MVFLVIVLSIIGSILFGGLIKYHFEGGNRFQSLQKTAVIIAEVPANVKTMIKSGILDLDKLQILGLH